MKVMFCPLFSGSSGNAVYMGTQRAHILVDAGVSAAAIERALKSVGVLVSELSGILITHEHTDHTQGVFTLCRKYGVPVYANRATFDGMGEKAQQFPAGLARVFETGQEFYVQDIAVRPFAIPHDAAEPVGYALHAKGKKACVMTDLGYVPRHLLDEVDAADVMLLESNHDVQLLEHGKYPAFLKRRILSRKGHLSNDSAGEAALQLAQRGVRRFYLGHLSKENNREDVALQTVCQALQQGGVAPGQDVSVVMAHRQRVSPIVRLD